MRLCDSCGREPIEFRVTFRVPLSEVVFDVCRGCVPRPQDDNDELEVRPLLRLVS
jgi:hypothetical protein